MRILAIDIGGTAIKHAVVDEEWGLHEPCSLPTASVTTQDGLIDALVRLHDAHAGRVSGLAVSTAGELDPADGLLFNGGALRFPRGMRLRRELAARIPVPVTVENDANCALLAEARLGALTGSRTAFVLIVGTGLGGALLVDGRLHRGAHFWAGSFSLPLRSIDAGFVADHPITPSAITAAACGVGALLDDYAARSGRPRAELDGRVLFDLVETGDAAATAALDAFATRLARVAYNTHMVLDVDTIAVGGGISRRPAFVAAVAAAFDALLADIAPWQEIPRPAIVPCRFTADANLLGAVVHHRADATSPPLREP